MEVFLSLKMNFIQKIYIRGMRTNFEEYTSECCNKYIYGLAPNRGLYCSECNKEIFSYEDKK